MNKIFIILNLCLLTIGIYIGVRGFYRIVSANMVLQTPESDMKKIPVVRSNISKPLAYYKKITDRNLFKTGAETSSKKKPVDMDLEGMQETELSLKLWGTVTGKTTFAVIEETKERKQNLYRVGDPVQHAVVKLILREKVVLDVNGRDEVLSIEETAKSASPKSFERRNVAGEGASPAESTQKITLQRSQVESAMANVTELMGQAKIRPHFENGRPDGLTLSSVKPRSIFRQMGLRNGDIITGVDGSPIQTVDDALKFYDNLTSASDVTLQLKRRGKEKVIEYSIK
ncbi:MAG: PDZ domain-containing protein [Desulfobacteraceae bacterium]|nr:MAG: PDZ domain-containing protein [Desulfobacteraceae bacterium]